MIEVNDIKKGMTITVLKWKSHFDRSYIGDELEVKAVATPFVKVHRTSDHRIFNLDSRDVDIMELPKSFTSENNEASR